MRTVESLGGILNHSLPPFHVHLNSLDDNVLHCHLTWEINIQFNTLYPIAVSKTDAGLLVLNKEKKISGYFPYTILS